MGIVCKLVCGDETLNLNDGTNYVLKDPVPRMADGRITIGVDIGRAGGNTNAASARLAREINRLLRLAEAWDKNRQGKPVDLVIKALDDGLGDIEPLYGRSHSRLRIRGGKAIATALEGQVIKRGILPDVIIDCATRPFYHGKLMDVADATGWVREVADKGVEIWEATTNKFVNPCLAFPTDYDQRWAVYNATDLVLAQSTSHWHSLGSAAKLTASATLPGVFYDDIALTNAAHILSAYVYKEGAAPTTADCEMWAGHVFENFTTAAAAPTAPLVESVAGTGNVVIAGGECQLDSSAANADAAIVYYNTALDADKIFRIRARFRCPTITHVAATVLSLTDKAAAPAISAGGAGTGGGTTEIWIAQNTAGGVTIRYWDNAGANFYWTGAAWDAAGTAHAGVVGTTYRADVVSNGTSWYVALYDASDVLLTQTTAVTWALTRAIANSLWAFSGDDDTTNYRSNMYLDYLKIDVGALTTTFTADEEKSGWYRATAAAFTMPSTTVNCGVEVKAGRYVYVDDFQCEAKGYPTPFANGDLLGCAWSGTAHDSTSVRTAGSLTLHDRYLYCDHGAITLWYKPGLPYNLQPNGELFNKYSGAANQIELFWEGASDTFQASINAGAATLTSAAQTFAAGDLIFIALVWDFTNDAYALYTNTTVDTDTTAMTAPGAGIRLGIGCSRAAAGSEMDGTIYDFRLWGDALTATQVGYVRAAGRGLGELPWLWAASTTYNHEDSAHYGSKWVGGIPGDLPPGLRLYTTNYAAFGNTWIAAKALDKGEYQAKYPYVLEAENMTWPGATEATVVDADHSNGNYETNTASDDPYGYIVPTTLDLFKLLGRWRVFARAACTGAATSDWNIAIKDLQCASTFPPARRWPVVNVAGNNTADEYYWLDLGVIDIPPMPIVEAMYGVAWPQTGTSNYIRLTLDINEAAAAETFRMDCIELLPDENLVKIEPYTISGTDVVFVDTTGDRILAGIGYARLDANEPLEAAQLVGNIALNPQCVNRMLVRISGSSDMISSGTGGSLITTALSVQLEPRFEALR